MVPRKLPRQEMSCKISSNLLDLPQPVIVQIAEHLSLKDLPSFVCACRELASIAAQIYGGRRVMDMRCFDVVTPKLCQQLILRFAAARLEKCVFSCSVTSFASRQQHIDHGTWNYDEDMMQAIVEHFLGNYPCNAQLITDLQSALTSEFTQWLPSDSSPRPIDVLAHCYLLEELLLSQPRLRELEVDFEFSIFKVPASRGYKQHWHLMKPFLALEVIQKGCPGLERYMAHEIRYQSCTINLQHLQVRFLERCPRLKVIGVTLGLDSSDLELYEHLTRPMALERAAFSLTKRPAHDEAQQLLNRRRMRALAGRMPSLEGVLIRFKARGSLKECKEFLLHLSCVRSLCFHCDFNAGYPSFDIDEGGEGGHFFEGVVGVVAPTVRKLLLMGVPEEDFEVVFGEVGKLPESVRAIRVQLRWKSSHGLGEERERLLAKFLSHAPHLKTYRIEGIPILHSSSQLPPLPLFVYRRKSQKQ